MKKILLSLLLLFLCSLNGMALVIDGVAYFIVGDEAWVTNDDSSDFKYVGDIIIPASITYNGTVYKVTRVKDEAFRFCKEITSITLPEGITHIGKDACDGCKNMKAINLPSTLKSIGSCAFFECESLESITIPNSVDYMGGKVFYCCYNLKSAVLSENVDEISKYTFYGCKNLSSVTIPEGVTTIGTLAFQNCFNLGSLHLPNSITRIWSSGLADCGIETVNIPDNLTVIEDRTFESCINLKSIVIPDKVTNISEFAFASCTSLTSVVIGDNVTSIGSHAFRHCESLSKVVFGKSDITFGNNVFWNSGTFTAEIHCKNINFKDFSGNINNVVFGEEVETIGERGLSYSKIESIVIPDHIVSIGQAAFSPSYHLKTAIIGRGVSNLEPKAFEQCEVLTSVYIPGNVKIISDDCFKNCPSLTEVTIEEGVKEIGEGAFAWCNALENIVFPNSIEQIDKVAFWGCNSITSITIPSGVKTIENFAFYDCKNLKSVTSNIPDPFEIDEGVFALEQSDIPSAILYVPAGTKSKYLSTKGWNMFKTIIEIGTTVETSETTVEAESLNGQDLTNNTVNDVYYNIGNGGYDTSDQSIVLGSTTDMAAISNSNPGSEDIKNNFTGIIMNIAKGSGSIIVETKTSGNAQLAIQINNQEPTMLSKDTKGKAVIHYSTSEDGYLYIYASNSSADAPVHHRVASADVRIYNIAVTHEATDIKAIQRNYNTKSHYYTIDGKKLEKMPTKKGVYIIDGRKVIIK